MLPILITSFDDLFELILQGHLQFYQDRPIQRLWEPNSECDNKMMMSQD